MNIRKLSRYIRKTRVNLGLTIEEVSKRTNLSESFIADLENGLIMPTSDELLALCLMAGIDVTIARELFDPENGIFDRDLSMMPDTSASKLVH